VQPVVAISCLVESLKAEVLVAERGRIMLDHIVVMAKASNPLVPQHRVETALRGRSGGSGESLVIIALR